MIDSDDHAKQHRRMSYVADQKQSMLLPVKARESSFFGLGALHQCSFKLMPLNSKTSFVAQLIVHLPDEDILRLPMVPIQQSLDDDYVYSITIDLRQGSHLRGLLQNQLRAHAAQRLQFDVTLFELVPVTAELLHAHHHGHLHMISGHVPLIRRCHAHRYNASTTSLKAAYGEAVPDSAAAIAVPRLQKRARVGSWALRHRLPKRIFKRSNFLQNLFTSTVVRYPIVSINALTIRLQNTANPQDEGQMQK